MNAAHRHTLACGNLTDAEQMVACDSCGAPTWSVYEVGVDRSLAVCERCYVLARDTVGPDVTGSGPEWRTIVVVTVLAWCAWLAPLGAYIAWQHVR